MFILLRLAMKRVEMDFYVGLCSGPGKPSHERDNPQGHGIVVLLIALAKVIVVGLPVVALLQDVSTDGRYIGTALLVWTMPMTTMILIMGPKMLAVRKARRNRNNVQGSTSKRGSSEGTRVTGITSPSNPTSVVPSCQQSAIGNQTTPGGVDNSRVQTVTLE